MSSMRFKSTTELVEHVAQGMVTMPSTDGKTLVGQQKPGPFVTVGAKGIGEGIMLSVSVPFGDTAMCEDDLKYWGEREETDIARELYRRFYEMDEVYVVSKTWFVRRDNPELTIARLNNHTARALELLGGKRVSPRGWSMHILVFEDFEIELHVSRLDVVATCRYEPGTIRSSGDARKAADMYRVIAEKLELYARTFKGKIP